MEVFEMLVKCIANIQPFDGNEKQLFNFINRIDALVPLIETLNIHFKRIIIGYIQDRLTHGARDTMLKHGQVETWTELKSVLKRAHGESTPINSLLDKIALCRCYGTIEQFYNQLSDLLIRLNNAYSLTEQLTNDQITCDKRIVLNCFTANLPEPVKGIIIVRNPPTMDDAYNIILTNGYSKYTNPHKQHPTSHSNYQQKQRNNDFRPRYNYHQNNNTQRRTEFQDPNRQQYNPNYNSSSNFTSAIMRTDKTIIHRATTLHKDEVITMVIIIASNQWTIASKVAKRIGSVVTEIILAINAEITETFSPQADKPDKANNLTKRITQHHQRTDPNFHQNSLNNYPI